MAPLHGYPEEQSRRLLWQRSGGLCEICWAQPATDYSHRQSRAVDQGGWCPCNALHACRDCHADRVHGQPNTALMYGWMVSRHAMSGVRFEPVWLPGKGWVRLTCTGTFENSSDPNL